MGYGSLSRLARPPGPRMGHHGAPRRCNAPIRIRANERQTHKPQLHGENHSATIVVCCDMRSAVARDHMLPTPYSSQTYDELQYNT